MQMNRSLVRQRALQGHCYHNRLFRCTCIPATAAPAQGPPQTCIGIPPEVLKQGGLDPSTQSEEQLKGYSESLRQMFLPVKLLHPGLRVLSLDPPVMTVDNFVSKETCQQLIELAAASGRMQVSKVGGTGPNMPENIRTSRTLAMTQDTLNDVPGLKEALQTLLDAAGNLIDLQDKSTLKASAFTKPNGPGQIVPELPQIAHYMPGQYFLAHEDAFPPQAALQKGYQRRATLLVYLNDVAEGGSTRFERMGFEVQPKQGCALLFFPSFSGGMPDARTLHTAVDAVSEKWIFQLWLSAGLPKPKPATPPAKPGGSKKKRK